MASLVSQEPHPRIAERKRTGPPKVADALPRANPFSRFNTRFALIITIAVGSMWCAYLFTLLALISLPSALKTHNKIIIVGWIAQTFLQLVLLPIIIVGQNVQAAAADKRAEATYEDAAAVLHTALQIQEHLAAQDAELQKIVAAVAARQAASPGSTAT